MPMTFLGRVLPPGCGQMGSCSPMFFGAVSWPGCLHGVAFRSCLMPRPSQPCYCLDRFLGLGWLRWLGQMTPALGTESREADHPGRMSGMKVDMPQSELRILSPSFKGPVCSFSGLKPSEKGKPCLPSMYWIPLLLL